MIQLSQAQKELLGNIDRLGTGAIKLYLVGGAVRDLFLLERLDDKDLDLIIEGDAAACARKFCTLYGGSVREFPEFLTAKVSNLDPALGFREVDFATARTEEYPKPGSLPVVTAASIKDDLRRRDFSINAMAVPLAELCRLIKDNRFTKEELFNCRLDEFSGCEDLNAKLIRILHDRSFSDDPTRAFRACRYAGRLKGKVEEKTAARLSEMVNSRGLETISEFRKMSEIRKIMEEAHWLDCCAELSRFKMFSALRFCGANDELRFMNSLVRMNQLPIQNSGQRIELVYWLIAYFLGHQALGRINELGETKRKAWLICRDVELIRSGQEAQASEMLDSFKFVISG